MPVLERLGELEHVDADFNIFVDTNPSEWVVCLMICCDVDEEVKKLELV